ncbi:MAG: hypothetical protein KKB37_14290 [Alphaproteobacteria bacterium]|nr:hypothetical protein [Alphaproteobacteria bacterium]
MQTGFEKRRVRFATIQGITRDHLPLAGEVWLEHVSHQLWTTRDVVKLATLFTRYMSDPLEELVTLAFIERTFAMDEHQIRGTLRQMKMFGAIEAYSFIDRAVHVSLCLTLLQRIRVLELKARVGQFNGAHLMFGASAEADRWLPPALFDDTDDDIDDLRDHSRQHAAPKLNDLD